MLMVWYTKQELCIRWGAEVSSYFTISNRVRQGGILYPSLFAVYMDYLSSLLNTSRRRCHIDGVSINHVFYADDLCLMTLCAFALQELINNINNNVLFQTNVHIQYNNIKKSYIKNSTKNNITINTILISTIV